VDDIIMNKNSSSIYGAVIRGVGQTGVSLLAGGLLAWSLLRWWPGDRLYPIRLLNYATPWLLLVLLPALVLAGWLRCRPIWQIVLSVPTLLISLPLLPLPRLGLAAPTAGQPLTVMSYSLCSANTNLPAAVEVIRQARPDLLLLQEVKPDAAEFLQRELADLYAPDSYNLQFSYEPAARQALLSRYPLRPLGLAPALGDAQQVRVELPGGPLTVWNVHVSQPQFWPQHTAQMQALAQAIPAVDGPLIVGGDFNSTPYSDAYRLLAGRLDNAHDRAGWGFGFTYPAPSASYGCRRPTRLPVSWPVVRIDHLFVSRHVALHQARTLNVSGNSDHLPVVAVVAVGGG
jgi:endonuclease/exonuclease/phosphatase family metal-dependent hydrolase